MAFSSPYSVILIKSSLIDLKSTGNTVIFTPTKVFVVTDIFSYGSSLSGTIGSPLANFGWTATDYSDLTSGYSTFASITGNINGSSLGSLLVDIPTIPASQSFRINVATADATATTNSQIIYVQGYYI